MSDKRNILDQFRNLETSEIKNHLQENSCEFSVLMENWEGDFNIGTLLRNANAFGTDRVFYIGKRSWDRRGAVGTHHYTDIVHIEVPIEFKLLKTQYNFVAFENHVPDSQNGPVGPIDLRNFDWPENPILVFGSESEGLSSRVLKECQYVVRIPQFGSVRSINAGVSSGIGMYDYISKEISRNDLLSS